MSLLCLILSSLFTRRIVSVLWSTLFRLVLFGFDSILTSSNCESSCCYFRLAFLRLFACSWQKILNLVFEVVVISDASAGAAWLNDFVAIKLFLDLLFELMISFTATASPYAKLLHSLSQILGIHLQKRYLAWLPIQKAMILANNVVNIRYMLVCVYVHVRVSGFVIDIH